MTLLKVENLSKSFTLHNQCGAVIPVMQGSTLSVAAGECVALTGASGSGKSTALNLIGALDRPSSGTVHLEGKDLGALNRSTLSRLRRDRIGFVFQAFHLLPHLNVLDNVSAPSLFSGAASVPQARDRARSVLERVGLADRAAAHPVIDVGNALALRAVDGGWTCLQELGHSADMIVVVVGDQDGRDPQIAAVDHPQHRRGVARIDDHHGIKRR